MLNAPLILIMLAASWAPQNRLKDSIQADAYYVAAAVLHMLASLRIADATLGRLMLMMLSARSA